MRPGLSLMKLIKKVQPGLFFSLLAKKNEKLD